MLLGSLGPLSAFFVMRVGSGSDNGCSAEVRSKKPVDKFECPRLPAVVAFRGR
jgi:Ni,Fe-hydrogenase III small subunit